MSAELKQRLGLDENLCKTFYHNSTFKEVCIKNTEQTWLEWVLRKKAPEDRFDGWLMIGGVTSGYARVLKRVPVEQVEEHLSGY